ncbi:hypothetical protein GMORB2_6568 [Geosmithia morbida]|uniref:Protein kinase domain-containing protein n=1 Tax=Geosmithia morbida TaxID=1094350 RepID=A0A9P5D4Q5_9HYPO|nr:uncharacterized protein GMORB2_6568 [Geosmithia morbida]KAF4123020.1 hypothetical protein GMORB2_6568 [Geosmithia morbida]
MDPGTALAVVSLSFEVFAGCIKGFVMISDARNMDKDAAVERTKLILQEYRLIEWARAINLDSPPSQPSSPLPSRHPAALILLQLEQLLSSTETLRKRYKLELVAPPDGSDDLVLSGAADESASSVLSSIVSTETRRGILEKSSKMGSANRMPKRLWWAAVDKKKLAQLIQEVTGLVDGLWSLLDISHRAQTSHAVNETLRLTIQASHDIKGLRDLQASLYDAATASGMRNGLAASAGLRAQHATLSLRTRGGVPSVPPRAPAVLDPARLSRIRMLSSTIGSALYEGSPVLIEEKHVVTRMKAKLRSRVEGLADLLSQPPTPTFQTFPCVGYTEEQAGFRLVFRLPSAGGQPQPLHNVLSRSNGSLPDVGTRLRLAAQVCQTLLSFHTAGWLHKDVRSENIILVSDGSTAVDGGSTAGLGQPHLCGFSFARQDSPTEISEQPTADLSRDIYRHAMALGEPSEAFERHMDAHSLGCVLIEIAEWTPLKKIVRKRLEPVAGAGVTLSDVAALSGWLHTRYISEGVAGFRLGAAFTRMLSLCIPAPGTDVNPPDLSDFYSALEGMLDGEI